MDDVRAQPDLLSVAVAVCARIDEAKRRSADGARDLVELRAISAAVLRLDQLRVEVELDGDADAVHADLLDVRAALDGFAIMGLVDDALARLRARAPHVEAPPLCACGARMRARRGRYGAFWGCADYPRCRRVRVRALPG